MVYRMRGLNREAYFLIFLLMFPQRGQAVNLMDKDFHVVPEFDPNTIDTGMTSSEEGLNDETYETTTMQNDAAIVEEYFEIPTNERLRLCGHSDNCPDMEKIRENKTGYVSGQDKLTLDYKRNPFACHCDLELCSTYGDCCVGLKAPVTPFLRNQSILLTKKSNPWHCHPLQKQSPPTWALMVSECPGKSAAAENTQDKARLLCEGQVNEIPTEHYTYLVDLPAYSNITQTLYKNIFCGLCNGEPNSNMIKWTMKFYCNHDFTPLDRPLFFDKATYIPIEREWRKNNKTCKLIISELDFHQIEEYIPNVRYCGYRSKADHCPRSKSRLDITTPSDGDLQQTNTTELSINYEHLCSSYTQFVFDKTNLIQFKNPHCAICNGLKDPKNLKCVRFVPGPDVRVTPGGSGATLHGVGLNFLFDFGVSEGNNYVGYDMLCAANEIWDYVRQKCHPLMCGQDHVLRDGHCVKPDPSPTDVGGMLENGNGNTEIGMSNVTQSGSGSDCYRILLYPHEFELLNNQSIAVNRSNNEIIILDQGDYEVVNNTMASICAKYLHEAFPARFSPILDYLTIMSLGLSVTLSFLHMFLFAMLPKLRNLPAKNLFCLTLCLFISQLCFLTLIRRAGGGLCIVAAVVMHFFFLAAFFWMNVLSFDIWRTFSSMMKARQGVRGSRGRTFVKYSIFAWSIPLTIVSLAVLTDFIILDDKNNDNDNEELYSDSPTLISRIKPSYGENGLCWISQRLSLFVFFAIPVFLVVLVNLFLFSRTAVAILAQQKESSKVFRGEHSKQHSSTSSDEARLKLYIKLALIMGLTWILGFVSASLSWDWLWYPFVVLNGLQGTFIFFSFDFKWKIFKMCTEVFTPLKPIMRGRGSTSSTTMTNVVTLSTSDQRSRNRVSVISNSSAVNI